MYQICPYCTIQTRDRLPCVANNIDCGYQEPICRACQRNPYKQRNQRCKGCRKTAAEYQASIATNVRVSFIDPESIILPGVFAQEGAKPYKDPSYIEFQGKRYRIFIDSLTEETPAKFDKHIFIFCIQCYYPPLSIDLQLKRCMVSCMSLSPTTFELDSNKLALAIHPMPRPDHTLSECIVFNKSRELEYVGLTVDKVVHTNLEDDTIMLDLINTAVRQLRF